MSDFLTTPDSYDNFLEQMKACAASIHELQRQAAQSCTPAVSDLIHTKSQDAQAIEHTLDRLLDCACHPEGLALFKSLCRYYFTLNQAATADYVRYYREMWDSESDPKQEDAL